MFRIFILSLLLCLAASSGGQIVDRTHVSAAVRCTVEEYFVPDIDNFSEYYADGRFDAQAVDELSGEYIEPNHFFHNDRKYGSYADWVREYIATSLRGGYFNHQVTLLNQELQKDSGYNDRYKVPIEFVRTDPVTEAEVGRKVRLMLTFVYHGRRQNVHILRLDGDIPAVPLPAPKESAEPVPAVVEGSVPLAVTEQSGVAVHTHTDSSYVMFFLSEAWLLLVEHWVLAVLLGFMVFMLFFTSGEELRFTSRRQQILASGGLTLIIGVFALGAWTATVRMDNPSRIRPHVLDAYDDYRVDSLYRVVAVRQGEMWGLVNYGGRVLYPVGLDSISPFSSSYSLVMSGKRYGYLQPDGSFVGWYDFGTPVVDDKCILGLRLDDCKRKITYSSVVLRADDNIYNALPYDRVEHWHGSLYKVWADNKQGLIDIAGNVVLPIEYDDIDWPHNDRAVIMKTSGSTELQRISNQREGLIDTSGKVIITPSSYRDIAGFHDGLARVETVGYRIGYIDKGGKLVIPCRFIDGNNFQNGMACARQNKTPGYWGVIDRKGNWVVQPEYQNEYKLAKMYGISLY